MQPIKYYGLYRGEIVDRDDPLGIGRCKVKVYQVFTNIEATMLPWAWPMLPAGVKAGFFFIPPVGSTVWVQFEMGDPDHPVWCMGWWGAPGGSPETPDDTRSGTSPDNYVIETPKGNRIELDDRDGQEKIFIRNKAGDFIKLNATTGRIEIVASGEIVIAAGGKGMVTAKTLAVTIQENANINIGGDATINAGGNLDVVASGDASISAAGNVDVLAGGDANVGAAGDASIASDGDTTVAAMGRAEIGSLGPMTVKSISMVQIQAPIIMEN